MDGREGEKGKQISKGGQGCDGEGKKDRGRKDRTAENSDLFWGGISQTTACGLLDTCKMTVGLSPFS